MNDAEVSQYVNEMRSQREDSETCYTVTEAERWTVINALVVAAEAATDHAKVTRDMADYLRGGGTHPLFAEGEDGGRACDLLAAQHDANAAEFRRLADLAEAAPRIVVDYSDEG